MCEIKGCGTHQSMPPINVSAEERRLFLKGIRRCCPAKSEQSPSGITDSRMVGTERPD